MYKKRKWKKKKKQKKEKKQKKTRGQAVLISEKEIAGKTATRNTRSYSNA